MNAHGNTRQEIYLDGIVCCRFMALLGDEVEQQHWRCYAYCLMRNRYHLLLETRGLSWQQNRLENGCEVKK